ncbi:UvrD-helicase domain-containing protein [uncultured Clostridium sp.]|jgi:DNA helicase-2/ATP-dependent DNA helicase PcrA|uniref:HelD family protein n=1 Tax=uncultured Clostridium sp. TaxID=59620 RepID=UPI00262D8E11|nr:UvrD-helicase domain-containing protein [uncultured Clostridium sp.]
MSKHDIDRTKNVEFLVEERKLEETSKIIAEEMLSYVNKRKFLTEYIVTQRKAAIEEYRDDEDKLIEYFDHESYVREESFKMIDRKLKELTILKDSPYFGRIGYTDKEFDEIGTLYVGRFGVTPEGTFEPVVVDWRAPIASLFYHGSLGEASYVAPSGDIDVDITARRQLIIKKAMLEGLFDSEVDVKDEILQMVLSNNTSEKLKDVIMTLQAEQDKIIRLPRTKNIVVNGVAGSGKTTIALHRVAYLLYNNREELEGKVLILGPNSIFMDYISQVLPSLGEVGVKQETFLGFAMSEIDEEISIMPYEEYLEKIVQKDGETVEREAFKNSHEFIEELDKFTEELSQGYFDIKPVEGYGDIIVSVDEIRELFDKHYAYMPLFRRAEKIKRILTMKIKDKRDEKFRDLIKEIKDLKESLSEEELVIQETDIEFKRKIKVRELVQEVMDIRKTLDEWIQTESCVSLYNKFNKNRVITVNDLAPILYLMIKFEGKKASKDFRHVVIDEAQDYSPLQFKVIRALIGSKYFTVVGDVNQRLIKYSEKAAMIELADIFNDVETEVYNLNNSYRSTSEIMNYANKFLKEDKIVPLVREGEKVEVLRTSDVQEYKEKIVSQIKKLNAQGLESVAIITRNATRLKEVWNLLKEDIHLVKFDNEDIFYKGGNLIIPTYFAKGLEFDGVIMADFEEDLREEDLIKYIMSTRALHSLSDVVLKK